MKIIQAIRQKKLDLRLAETSMRIDCRLVDFMLTATVNLASVKLIVEILLLQLANLPKMKRFNSPVNIMLLNKYVIWKAFSQFSFF